MPTKKKGVATLPPLTLLGLVIISITIFWLFSPSKSAKQTTTQSEKQEVSSREFASDPISLSTPAKTGRVSVEQALNTRRSERSFLDKSLTEKQVSQVLWAAQGVTTDWGGRTAPSAKSAYPLTVYLIALDVTGVEPGIYQYIPGDLEPVHQLGPLRSGDFTEQTATAGRQSQFQSVPAVLVITGNMQKMTDAFDGKPSDNNVYLEAGHVGENIYLQAKALGLGTVATGGFDKEKTTQLLDLPSSETLIYMMPLGYPGE